MDIEAVWLEERKNMFIFGAVYQSSQRVYMKKKGPLRQKVFWVLQRTTPTNGLEAKHTRINTDEKLAWTSNGTISSTSLAFRDPVFDEAQADSWPWTTDFSNKVNAKRYLMTGWDFDTHSLTKHFILAKRNGSLCSGCNFGMSSDSSSRKYIIIGFCSTKWIITC